jgi:hypothetical protein
LVAQVEQCFRGWMLTGMSRAPAAAALALCTMLLQ